MLTFLIAIGVLTAELQPGTGELTAPAERIAIVPKVQSKTLVAAGMPLGAPKYAQDYDPSDRCEYAIDFGTFMEPDERIIDVLYIGVDAAGAALGVAIDTAAGHIPIITDDGRHVQFWPLVSEAQWSAVAFDASGVPIQYKVRVLTNKGRIWERSSISDVRQM